MHQSPILTVSLRPGQTQGVLLEAGSVVHVNQGRLKVEGPVSWLDGMPLPWRQWLCSEESLPVQEGGWLTLSAQGPTVAVIIPPQRLALARRIMLWCSGRSNEASRPLSGIETR